MAEGEGTFWEGDVTNKDGVTFEVTVTSSPVTGAVRIEILADDTAATIARKLREEWNARQPIEDVRAVPTQNESQTDFSLEGQWQEGEHHITMMAATFDGKPRATMSRVNDFVKSSKNPGLKVTWVKVSSIVMKEASMPQEQVAASAKKTQPLPEKAEV
jgi:hypothetical protein